MKTLFNYALIVFICSNLNAQNFTSLPFKTLPGDNYDMNVLSPEMTFPGVESYLVWMNKQDSIYTVYLKQLLPSLGEEINVSRDNIPKSNPQLSINRLIRE